MRDATVHSCTETWRAAAHKQAYELYSAVQGRAGSRRKTTPSVHNIHHKGLHSACKQDCIGLSQVCCAMQEGAPDILSAVHALHHQKWGGAAVSSAQCPVGGGRQSLARAPPPNDVVSVSPQCSSTSSICMWATKIAALPQSLWYDLGQVCVTADSTCRTCRVKSARHSPCTASQYQQ